MMLPGAERAAVDVAKIRDYLLSHEHPIGRFKAVFFESLGYAQSDWTRLQAALLDLARTRDAVEGQASQFGQKYQVRGSLIGPSGRQADIVTVWVVLAGEDFPRLVTAYPG